MRHFGFKSIADLSRDVRAWLDDLPTEFDVVAGIPRSGLLVASLISVHRHVPLTDIEGLVAGRLISGGRRFDPDPDGHSLEAPKRVLVVDDSILTGRQIETVRRRLQDAHLPHEIKYAAVYVDNGREGLVDFYHECLPFPRMFEWNLMHHPTLDAACVDIDGVLCRDPTPAENDDGVRYAQFIETVQARFKPTYRIHTLVTARLEKYRAATEEWLARNGILYDNLLMMPYASKAERVAAGRYGAFKAEAYQAAGAMIFIESNHRQAQEIADRTARPVICTDRMRLCVPSIRSRADVVKGLRAAGSLSGRVRWLRTHRRSILWWIGRRKRKRRGPRAA